MPRDRNEDRYDDEDDRPRRRSRRDDFDDEDGPPPKKGMSTGVILAIVFGVVVVVAIPVIAVLIGLLLPAVQKVREAASRAQSSNNMKEVALAAHNHEATYTHLPAPFVVPPPGATVPVQDRLSWRASLLPYMGHDNLFKQLKPDQPWNGPANGGPANTVIKAYGDPLDPVAPATRFRCFYDNGAAFSSDPTRRATFPGMPDGTANVILYVESADTVPWAQFNDFRFEPTGPLPQLGHQKRAGFLVAMADGSVKFVNKSVSPDVLKRCITASDGAGLGTDLDR
jgi:hypothetical protein